MLVLLDLQTSHKTMLYEVPYQTLTDQFFSRLKINQQFFFVKWWVSVALWNLLIL
jgi:hypothetical protein